MVAGLRSDGAEVGPLLFEHLPVVRVDRDLGVREDLMVLRGLGLGPVKPGVAAGDETNPVGVLYRGLDVFMADPAATDEGNI